MCAYKTLVVCLLLVLFVALPIHVRAECNVCSVFTNLACVSQTQFQVCIDGIPTGSIDPCPTGYVCSSATSVICQPNEAGVITACNDCNTCDSTGTFACTGARTYALCLGTTTPSTLTGSCAPSLVCNIDYPQICGDTTLGIPATCSYLGDTTTTTTTVAPTIPSPIDNPTAYCRAMQQVSRFPIGFDTDTTCRRYVYCFLTTSGVWSGQLYTCPGRTYFNSATRLCGTQIPTTCSSDTRTQSLMVSNNLLLIS